ncbi:MAG TPA: DUF4870 domain-containing protein [Actinomycetota bacterium]|nr:DUF4870 domain-containing protein [Actinomycetota bacterium]
MSQQGPPPPPSVPPGGGPPGQTPAGGPPLTPDQERLWGMLAHLLSFVAAYLFLGFVAPLIIMLVFGPRSAFVRANAVESLNFNLTWLLYGIIGVILALLLIGFLILIALGIAYLVLVIIASVRANNGEVYRYPLTIRFVR